MNFSDFFKEHAADYAEEGELIEEVEAGEIHSPEELLAKISHYEVTRFLAMDKELFDAGYSDKDERLRIIEIIF